jgi:SAM-dependent methyltransferase
MENFWDKRYSEEEYAYGEGPNNFLQAEETIFPRHSAILCLSEGEGRNAVYLAQKGHNVTAMDFSAVGMKKAAERARRENVKLTTIVADLKEFDMGDKKWDGIISIFGHLPPDLRMKVHKDVLKALKPGGLFLLEAYTPEQLMLKTGGPQDENMMLTLEKLTLELGGLETIIKRTCIREIHEGRFHNGFSAVVQFIGRKVK